MPFSGLKPLARGVYFPIPVLSPQGWPMAIAVSGHIPGDPPGMGRQLIRETIPPDADVQAVLDDMWARLDQLDRPQRHLQAI